MANTYWTFGAFTPYVGAGYTYYKVNFSGKWTNQIPFYAQVESKGDMKSSWSLLYDNLFVNGVILCLR